MKVDGWKYKDGIWRRESRTKVDGWEYKDGIWRRESRIKVGPSSYVSISFSSGSVVHFFPPVGEGRGGKGRPSVGMEGVREVLGMHRRGQEELIIAHVVARFKPAAALNVTCLKCMVNEVKWRGAFSPHHTTRGDTGLVEFEIITK